MATKKKKPEDLLPVGRKSKYEPRFCQMAIDLMSEGYSLFAVASECGVALSTIYEWESQFPEFSDALKIGKSRSAFWWEKTNRNFAETGVGNATSIIFGLKNRAKELWQDKTEIEQTTTHKVAIPDFADLE